MTGWSFFLLAQGRLAARLALSGFLSEENTFERESQRLLVPSQTQSDLRWPRPEQVLQEVQAWADVQRRSAAMHGVRRLWAVIWICC